MKLILTLSIILCISFSQEFQGQVGIITGASTGIGFSTMQLLARQGANIVFCARDSHPTWFSGKQAEEAINSDPIVQKNQGSATFVKADIRNSTQFQNVISVAVKKFGRFDFAVNNAGIGGKGGRMDQIEQEDLFGEHDALYNNLYGTLNCLRYETRWIMKNGQKNRTYSIVNLSSYNGLRGCPTCSLYAASKFAIAGLTKSAALEFADTNPKIKINAVAPGFIDTSLTRNTIKQWEYGQEAWEGDFIAKDDPIWLSKYKPYFAKEATVGGKLGEPEEIASVIAFLISNDSSYVGGSMVSIDNGFIAL